LSPPNNCHPHPPPFSGFEKLLNQPPHCGFIDPNQEIKFQLLKTPSALVLVSYQITPLAVGLVFILDLQEKKTREKHYMPNKAH